ncbi:hypothetical protein B5G37_07040 [Pseudoflavonifractor sp. An85]|nr:hypothetical protein B5G37_07040 [Pseudoflavonifractor sp. An85]
MINSPQCTIILTGCQPVKQILCLCVAYKKGPPTAGLFQTIKKLTLIQIGQKFLYRQKSLEQNFSALRRKNQSKSVFPGDMRIGKNTSQPASVALGRPLTQGYMQRAVPPRENAGIFEKRVELFRHAKKTRRRRVFFLG